MNISRVNDCVSALNIAFDLANRSIERQDFTNCVNQLVNAVAESNHSISKSLQDQKKVNDLIKDFQNYYFSEENPDIFSHKLMKRVIKHDPIVESNFNDTAMMAASIARRFECEPIINRPDHWLTHFCITLIGPAQFDTQREIGKDMPKEKLEVFLSRQQALLEDLLRTHRPYFRNNTLIRELIAAIEDLNLQAPLSSLRETPSDSFNYLASCFESLILEFKEFKENAREVVISTLNIYLEASQMYPSED